MQKTANGQRVGTNLDFGNELVGSGLTGLGAGAGVVALYHLLDKMKREKALKRIAPPGLTAISSGAPLIEESTEQKAASNLSNAAVGGLLGALGGGAYGALSSEPKEKDESRLMAKLRGALRGAAASGAVGAGLGAMYNPASAALGAVIPDRLLPPVRWKGKEILSPTSAHAAWRNIANLGMLGGGVLGGRAIVNSLADKEKEEERAHVVDDARRAYFDALSGKDEKAASVLDQRFKEFEKTGSMFYNSKHESTVPTWAMTAMLLSALGGAGVGGTYMYNRTKKLSDAENLRRALESRARTRGNSSPWVDPDELASAKQLALPVESAEPRRLNVTAHG